MMRSKPMPKKETETEIKEPVKFRTRYPAQCVACGRALAVNAQVEGVRLKEGSWLKWYVWHDRPACHHEALWVVAQPLPRTEITSPQKFRARYSGQCVACGSSIPVNTQVEGVRLKGDDGLRWYVWHDRPACHQQALTAILPTEKARP